MHCYKMVSCDNSKKFIPDQNDSWSVRKQLYLPRASIHLICTLVATGISLLSTKITIVMTMRYMMLVCILYGYKIANAFHSVIEEVST